MRKLKNKSKIYKNLCQHSLHYHDIATTIIVTQMRVLMITALTKDYN